MVEKFLNHHKLIISTLSPIHIGCQQDYEPINYIMDEGVLYTFDPVRVFGEDDNSLQKLNDLADSCQGEEGIKQLQRFFYGRRNQIIANHNTRMPVSPALQTFYKNRIDLKATQTNKLEIARTSFNLADNRPYLPGSSLKGAIRTALLDALHGGSPLSNPKDAEFWNPKYKKNWKLLDPIPETLKLALPKDSDREDFARDPMRMIRLTDFHEQTAGTNKIYFALNLNKKDPEKYGPYQILECLSPLRLQSFIGSMNLLIPKQARNFDDQQPKQGLPSQQVMWSRQGIAGMCNDYYWDLLQYDLTFSGIHKKWQMHLQKSLDELMGLLMDGKAFLLRVGRHSGAESVTLNGARRIHIPQDETNPWQAETKSIWLAGNKEKQVGNLLPFGWLLVEFDYDGRKPLTESVPELVEIEGLLVEFDNDGRKPLTESVPELIELEEEINRNAISLLQKSTDKIEELRPQVDKIEALASQKAKEAQGQRAREEEQRLRLEAEYASLASMGEQRRKIFEFRKKIQNTPDRQSKSGTLWYAVNTLIKETETTNWSQEDKTELKRVIQEELSPKLKHVNPKDVQGLLDRLA